MGRELVPTEAEEGLALVAYLRVKGIKFSHIANETGGTPEARRRAIRVKRQGVSKGFPDYVIALPGVGMLYIELKRLRGSKTSPEQLEWVDTINKCPGAEAHICKGAQAAIDLAVWLILVGLVWATVATISSKFLGWWAFVTGIVFLVEAFRPLTIPLRKT